MATWKNSVKAATTADLGSGSPPPFPASGAIDSVTLAVNDRVLIKDQATPSQNGIYKVIQVRSGLRRRPVNQFKRDFDMDVGATDDVREANVRVSQGAINAHTQHVLTTQSPVVGTTPLRFVPHNPTFVEVRAASTGNVTLPTPASTTIDGVTLTAGDRVLLKDQTIASENGVYLLNDLGKLERFGDPVGPDTTVRVSEGDRNKHTTHSRVTNIYPPWAAKTSYLAGARVTSVTNHPGKTFEATAAVTSGATEPNWDPVIGHTTPDNGGTWTAVVPTTVISFAPQNLVFNVRDFGAVGDGVTDDSPAITATLAAALANANPNPLIGGAGTVFFPVGIYPCSENIVVNRALKLEGANPAGPNDGAGSQIKFAPGKGLFFRGTKGFDQPFTSGACAKNLSIMAQAIEQEGKALKTYQHEHEYNIGDLIYLPHHHENIFECIETHRHLLRTGPRKSHPRPAAAPAWTASTDYAVGSQVTPPTIDGHVYTCHTSGKSGLAAPRFLYSYLDVTTEGVVVDKGQWSAATPYDANDIVTLASVSYICILGHTTIQTPPNATYWTRIGPWSAATPYVANDTVIGVDNYAGARFICILGHTNQQPPNATYWTPMGWPWGAATAYVANVTVTLDGVPYICILGHTNQTPPNATYWTPLLSWRQKEDKGSYLGWADVVLRPLVSATDPEVIWHAGQFYFYNSVVRVEGTDRIYWLGPQTGQPPAHGGRAGPTVPDAAVGATISDGKLTWTGIDPLAYLQVDNELTWQPRLHCAVSSATQVLLEDLYIFGATNAAVHIQGHGAPPHGNADLWNMNRVYGSQNHGFFNVRGADGAAGHAVSCHTTGFQGGTDGFEWDVAFYETSSTGNKYTSCGSQNGGGPDYTSICSGVGGTFDHCYAEPESFARNRIVGGIVISGGLSQSRFTSDTGSPIFTGNTVQNLRSIDSTNRAGPPIGTAPPSGTGTGNITFYMGQNAGTTDGRMAFAIQAEGEGQAQGMTWSNAIPKRFGSLPTGWWYWAYGPGSYGSIHSAFAVSGEAAAARRGAGTKSERGAGEFMFPQEGFYLGGAAALDTIRRFQLGEATPVAGTWIAGDRIWNKNPAGNGISEWVCTVVTDPWAANTSYHAGARVISVTNHPGNTFQAAGAVTSGANEPTWDPVIGHTTPDNGGTWTALVPVTHPWAAKTPYDAGAWVTSVTNHPGNTFQAAGALTSGANEPTWDPVIGHPTPDNGGTWTAVAAGQAQGAWGEVPVKLTLAVTTTDNAAHNAVQADGTELSLPNTSSFALKVTILASRTNRSAPPLVTPPARVTHELLCHSTGGVLTIDDDTITATTNTPGYTMTLSAPGLPPGGLVLRLACTGLTGSNVSFKATIEMVSLAGN